jgi:hypothetical protein
LAGAAAGLKMYPWNVVRRLLGAEDSEPSARFVHSLLFQLKLSKLPGNGATKQPGQVQQKVRDTVPTGGGGSGDHVHFEQTVAVCGPSLVYMCTT